MSGCVLGTSPVNWFLISVLVLHLTLMKSLISVYDDFLERQEKPSWRSKIVDVLCYPLLPSMRTVFRFAPRRPHYVPELPSTRTVPTGNIHHNLLFVQQSPRPPPVLSLLYDRDSCCIPIVPWANSLRNLLYQHIMDKGWWSLYNGWS